MTRFSGHVFISCCWFGWTFALFLFRASVWALCPNGFYLDGIRISGPYLYQIEEAKCGRPQNHPDSYDHCYDGDVSSSFDNAGWSTCKQEGYYVTGFYKSSCNWLYCIEKFKCCRTKKRNCIAFDFNWLATRMHNSDRTEWTSIQSVITRASKQNKTNAKRESDLFHYE